LYYLGIYVALSGAYILAIAARVGINYFGSLRASRSLYDRLLKRILGAKMRYVGGSHEWGQLMVQVL
jgi:hypothetical protein